MANWSWLIAQLVVQGGNHPARPEVLGEMTLARGRSVEFDLRGPAKATWTLDGEDVHAEYISELISDLFVWRDRRLLGRFRVGSCDDQIAENHEVTCSAVDYRGVLERRILLVPHDYPGWYPEHIGLDMVNIAQLDVAGYSGGGALSIWPDLGEPLRQRLLWESFDADTKASDNISRFEEYSEEAGGFEWWIDPDPNDYLNRLIFHTRTWRGAERDQFPLVLGTTVTEARRTFDTAAYANHVILTGGKPDKPPQYKAEDPDTWGQWEPGRGPPAYPDHPFTFAFRHQLPARGRFTPDARWVAGEGDWEKDAKEQELWWWDGPTNQWRLTADELPTPRAIRDAGEWWRRPMGRISRAVTDSDLKTAEAVDAAADSLLAESLRPAASYDCKLRDGFWTGPDDCWLGDRVPISIRRGRLNKHTTARVWGIKLDIDDDGEETVTITLDQTDPEDWS